MRQMGKGSSSSRFTAAAAVPRITKYYYASVRGRLYCTESLLRRRREKGSLKCMPPFWPPQKLQKRRRRRDSEGRRESSQCKSGSCYDTIYYPLLFCTRKKFLSKRFILTAAQQLLFFFRSWRALRLLRLLLADMNVEQGKAIYLGPHENPQKKRKVTISKIVRYVQKCYLPTLEYLVTVHKAKSKGVIPFTC